MASDTAAHAPDLELRVQRGPQAGARSPLPPMDDTRGWELHIGGTPAQASDPRRGGRRRHDLMLVGASPARLRATPAGDGRHIRLELLEGLASIDGRPLPAATPVPWPMYSNLQVADVALAFGSAVEPTWDASGARDGDGESPSADDGRRAGEDGASARHGAPSHDRGATVASMASTAARQGRSTTSDTNLAAGDRAGASDLGAAAHRWPLRLVVTGASLVIASLLLFGLVKQMGWGTGKPHNVVLVEQALSTKGFTQLKMQLNAAGVPVISGSLPSRADQRALEELLARLGATAKLDIQLPSLSEQVAQFFARIGVPGAQIENLGGGRILARTRSAALATATQIDEAVADARREITGLEQLTIQNEAPSVAAADSSSCGKAANDPGKKPTLAVSDGKKSALMTADGSRYGLGSTLPSGHVLISIDKDKTITVECDGRFSSFRL